MVAKISSNTSLFGTINYNKLKLENNEAKVLFSQNMFEKQDGSFSMSLCMKSFEPYLAVNKRTEKPIFYVSLNPDPKDKLDDGQLSEIAEKYMEQMGYGNQPYIVFKHNDIDRIHLHVVSCRVDETGKKIDCNFENRRSMDVFRSLEKEYQLRPAEKRQRADEIPIKGIDYKRGDVKHQVSNTVKALLNNYNFQSFREFRTLLELLNVTVEEVRGMSPKGEMYNGIIYSATDDNKNRVGTPFKSSLFGKQVGYEALQTKYEKSVLTVKEKRIREQIIPVVCTAMKTANSMKEFELLVKKENIQPIFRQNEDGRIYGVTFIDHNSRTVLNGSRLGKEFSANQFQELFSSPEIQEKSNFEMNLNPVTEIGSIAESVVGGLFDLLPTVNDIHEENPQFPKPIKKKKKGFGRGF